MSFGFVFVEKSGSTNTSPLLIGGKKLRGEQELRSLINMSRVLHSKPSKISGFTNVSLRDCAPFLLSAYATPNKIPHKLCHFRKQTNRTLIYMERVGEHTTNHNIHQLNPTHYSKQFTPPSIKFTLNFVNNRSQMSGLRFTLEKRYAQICKRETSMTEANNGGDGVNSRKRERTSIKLAFLSINQLSRIGAI
jgi:hypothetical protein